MSVTIKDVAKIAGVSISTVSKVINHASSISQPTIDHVNQVMRELDYLPNARAAGFARQSTRTVAFLSALKKGDAYNDPYMFDTLCGAQSYLSAKGFALQLIDVLAESTERPMLERLIMQQAVDGVIVHGSALSKALESTLNKRKFPHIIIGAPAYERQLCWIDTDNSLAGQIAGEHLLKRGFTRIAYIGGEENGQLSRQRLSGVREAVTRAGGTLPDGYIRYTESSLEISKQAVQALLALDCPPDAIVCESNTIALGVLERAKSDGLRIPDQLGMVTFDRYPYADIMNPSPTMILIDVNDLGREAAKLLIRKIHNPELLVHTFTTLPVLVQGQTT
ncbi:MAG: LacI family DNA-binding transcriptional regulator [Clostridia bacterium]